MRRSLLYASLAALCLSPTAGLGADRLALLAEDTPGMTRVEIQVGEIPFSLEKPGPGVIDFVTPFRFKSINLGQLIAGDAARRVANARIVPDDAATRLRMVLKCDCSFDFSVSAGVLSVRIKDPVDAGIALAEAELAEAPPEAAPTAPRKPAPDAAPTPLARPAQGASASLVAAAPAPGAEFPADAPDIAATAPDPAAEIVDAPTEEVVLARDHLMRQLSRAAEQGLIQFVSDEAAAQSPEPGDVSPRSAEAEPDEPPRSPETTAENPPPEASPEPERADAPASAPPQPVEIPLRARTAVDKDFTPDRSETRADVAYCIDPARLDLAAWAEPGPFLEVKQDLRAQLLDEFDQARPDIATRLARHLMLNGFGAEAREMARVYGDAVKDHEVLDDLARLIDLMAPNPTGHIARTAPCHADAALWRAIAGLPDGEPAPGDDGSDDVNRQALDAFARLPAITRRLLRARLMNNLISKGELALAGQLDLILRRSPSPDEEALALARARLLSKTGKLEEAEALYARLSQSNRPEAHQALILLLDSRINRNAGGSFQLSDALGDAAFSARGTAAELPLKVAEIRSRTLTDGASGALSALQSAMDRTGGPSELLRDVGHAALERLEPVDGDVIDYAKAVMSLRPHVSTGASGDAARRQVARVLTEAGLPNLALTYIEPALDRPNQATSLVAARALLALDQAEAALATLETLTGPSAIPLKVDALERLGRHEEAHFLSSGAEQDDGDKSDGDSRSARALRAGEWADASRAGETPQRLLAAYMASKKSLDDAEDPSDVETDFLTPPEVDRETTLNSVRSVVEASRSARSIIEKALEDG